MGSTIGRSFPDFSILRGLYISKPLRAATCPPTFPGKWCIPKQNWRNDNHSLNLADRKMLWQGWTKLKCLSISLTSTASIRNWITKSATSAGHRVGIMLLAESAQLQLSVPNQVRYPIWNRNTRLTPSLHRRANIYNMSGKRLKPELWPNVVI